MTNLDYFQKHVGADEAAGWFADFFMEGFMTAKANPESSRDKYAVATITKQIKHWLESERT